MTAAWKSRRRKIVGWKVNHDFGRWYMVDGRWCWCQSKKARMNPGNIIITIGSGPQRLIECETAWLNDWLADRLNERMNEWMSEWMSEWTTDYSTKETTDSRTERDGCIEWRPKGEINDAWKAYRRFSNGAWPHCRKKPIARKLN